MKSIALAVILNVWGLSAAAQSLHEKFANSPDENLLELVTGDPRLIQKVDDSQCTALHYAARYGRLQTAKWLIEHKADVNSVAYNQFTPMHVAANGDVARLLIQAGANLKAIDSWSKTPLQNAAQDNRTEVCEAILASGYPADLSSAIRLGKRDLVKNMIRTNPAIVKEVQEDFDLWGNTSPLGVAASKGDKELVELLLKAGAPVNAVSQRPNAGPMTALCNAVWA